MHNLKQNIRQSSQYNADFRIEIVLREGQIWKLKTAMDVISTLSVDHHVIIYKFIYLLLWTLI